MHEIMKDEDMKSPITLPCSCTLLTVSVPFSWTSKQWLNFRISFLFYFDSFVSTKSLPIFVIIFLN